MCTAEIRVCVCVYVCFQCVRMSVYAFFKLAFKYAVQSFTILLSTTV